MPLQTDRYDRFPHSGLVRGGMWFLDAGEAASYHSHDGAPEIFVFLRETCNITDIEHPGDPAPARQSRSPPLTV